jgi:hypothetical protein
MRRAGFEVERQLFFNRAGVWAWRVANLWGRQRVIKPWQLRLYNLLTPMFRWLERVLPGAGLSTIVVARQPRRPEANGAAAA